MAITWTDVTNIANELATAPVGLQTVILAQVNEELNADAWGSRIDRGRAWLAAHLATVAQRKGGSSGPVTSIRVGEVAKTFAAPPAGVFASTAYGAEYERQLMQLPAARFAVSE